MGLGIVACGLVIGWQASGIRVAPIYAKVGPAAFLWFAALLLILCGAIVSWRARTAPTEEAAELAGPLTILGGLFGCIMTLELAGFIPAATLLFVMTARGLGSRRLLRDLLTGLAVTAVAYLVFAKGLGLRLPTGIAFWKAFQ